MCGESCAAGATSGEDGRALRDVLRRARYARWGVHILDGRAVAKHDPIPPRRLVPVVKPTPSSPLLDVEGLDIPSNERDVRKKVSLPQPPRAGGLCDALLFVIIVVPAAARLPQSNAPLPPAVNEAAGNEGNEARLCGGVAFAGARSAALKYCGSAAFKNATDLDLVDTKFEPEIFLGEMRFVLMTLEKAGTEFDLLG